MGKMVWAWWCERGSVGAMVWAWWCRRGVRQKNGSTVKGASVVVVMWGLINGMAAGNINS